MYITFCSCNMFTQQRTSVLPNQNPLSAHSMRPYTFLSTSLISGSPSKPYNRSHNLVVSAVPREIPLVRYSKTTVFHFMCLLNLVFERTFRCIHVPRENFSPPFDYTSYLLELRPEFQSTILKKRRKQKPGPLKSSTPNQQQCTKYCTDARKII